MQAACTGCCSCHQVHDVVIAGRRHWARTATRPVLKVMTVQATSWVEPDEVKVEYSEEDVKPQVMLWI